MFLSKRRRGKFSLTATFIKEFPDAVKAIMQAVVIIEAQYSFDGDRINYIAYSPYFDPVKEGGLLVEYSFLFSTDSLLGQTTVYAAYKR